MLGVSDLLLALADYGFEDTGTERKVEKVQAAIWAIERRKPWPFLETSANLSFDGSSGTPTAPPARFRSGLKTRDMTTGRRLEPLRLDDAEEHIGVNESQAGDPILYYFEGGQIKVWPVPPAGRIVRLKYIQRSPAIDEASTWASGDILIPNEHYEVILYGALQRLYAMEDDVELAVAMAAQFEKSVQEMEADIYPQQFDRPDYIHVFDPDDYDLDFI